MRAIVASVFLLAACASDCGAQIAGAPRYSAEALREDFATLYEGLQASHYDLFANTPRPAFDEAYERMRTEIDGPMTALEARVLFQRFVALSHVAHARLDFPSAEFGAYREAGGVAFPLSTRTDGGRIFVAQDLSGGDSAQPGDEIIALNGTPAATLLERLRAHISADTDALAYAQIDQLFAPLLWLEFGAVEQFSVTLRHGESQAEALTPARSRTEMRAAAADAPASLAIDPSERVARMLPGGVAYLRPGIFLNYPSENLYDTAAFHAFIDEAFAGFLAQGATTLLIDVRDNPGGDNSFSDHMIAWFADESFRFTSDFRIRVSPQTRASNAARLAQEPGGVSEQLAALYASARDGDIVHFDIPIAQPRTGERFEGRVFVLINRRSYSNAVSVAAIVQDYGFGTIIGEPTADLATTFGAMEQFTLPNTGFTIGYPKALIVRPSGDTRVAGVTPDIAIETPIREPAGDPVLQRALALVATP